MTAVQFLGFSLIVFFVMRSCSHAHALPIDCGKNVGKKCWKKNVGKMLEKKIMLGKIMLEKKVGKMFEKKV